jgi:predicted phosphodiesterase
MSATVDPKKLKRIDIFVSKKGETPTKKNKAYSFPVNETNWNEKYDFDVYSDLVSDSAVKSKVSEFSVQFSGDMPPPPPPPPPDIPIAILMANPPVAKVGERVVLDASLSKNCDTITFSQISGENMVTIEDTPDPKQKQFTAPDVQTQTNLGFKIIGEKGGNTSEANVVVIVTPVNQPPPPPPDPTHKLVRMVIMSDNDITSHAEKTMQYSVQVPDTNLIIHVGDGPYDNSGTKWVAMMRKYITDTLLAKFRIAKGNHDCSSSESNQTQIDIENWLVHLKDPSIPANRIRDNLWLKSEQIGNVFNIYMDSEDMDVEFKDKKQYNWVKEQIEKAKQLKAQGLIDWVFVYFHKPFFTLKSSHSPYTSVRFLYKDLFKDIVDIIFHGHNHNTQLWLPMIPNQSTANGEGSQLFTWKDQAKRIFDFTKEHGWLTVVCGHAGHEWNEINDSGSGVQNVMHYRDSGQFGLIKVDVVGKNAKIIELDNTGKEYFSYEVSKEDGTIPPPPPPPPPDDDVDAKFPELLAKGKVGSMFLLDGSLSTGNIKNWNITQIEGQTVQLENVPNLKYSKQFIMPNERLKFTLTVFSDTKSNSDTITVDPVTDIPPPPVENGLTKIHDSSLVLSKEHTVKSGQFSSVDPQIDMTNAGQGDKTLYIKKGSNGQNYITFGGERTRWNVFYSKDHRTPNDWNKIPKSFCNLMYEVEWSPLNANCRNLSFSFRTIHDPLSDGKEGFGKFGMHWGISDGPEVGIKVEYFHNEHGSGHDFPLPKKIEIGKKVKTRMWIWSDPTGKREVTQFGQIQYEGDPKWYDVVKFTYTSSNWGSPPSGGSSVDKAEITGGPYMLAGIRSWCRSNGGGQFNIYSFNLYRIEQIPNI